MRLGQSLGSIPSPGVITGGMAVLTRNRLPARLSPLTEWRVMRSEPRHFLTAGISRGGRPTLVKPPKERGTPGAVRGCPFVRFGIARWISSRSQQFGPPQMSAAQQRVYALLRRRPTADATGFAQACQGTRGGADLPDRGTGILRWTMRRGRPETSVTVHWLC